MTEGEEKLPPWRIETRGDRIVITDGDIAFVQRDAETAFRGLILFGEIWPQGTAKASKVEIAKAETRGARRAFPLCFAAGIVVATLCHAMALWLSR